MTGPRYCAHWFRAAGNKARTGLIAGTGVPIKHTESACERATSKATAFLYPDPVPELPEVETIVQGLAKRVTGDTIDSVWVGSRKQPLKSPARKIASTLEGKQIARVHRAGKHIVFDLE